MAGEIDVGDNRVKLHQPVYLLPISAFLWACAFHGTILAPPVCIAAVMLWVLLAFPPGSSAQASSSEPQGAHAAAHEIAKPVNGTTSAASNRRGGQVCVEAIVLPTATYEERKVLRSNDGKANHFENDNCRGSWVAIHDPEDRKAPYGEYFAERKRRWEIRWQLEFKRTPKGTLVFGLELEEYVPLSAWSRQLQGWTVNLLQRCVGSDLYHSPGDDPGTATGELERPCFAMPLWAFDQLVVSRPGEEPDITKSLEGLGVRRSEGRVAFVRMMSDLRFEPGMVYTFSFWCISRFIDPVNWEIVGIAPGKKIDFNTFCGRPPVNVCIYELEPDDKEKRHLQSRKNYLFHCSLWSAEHRPPESSLAKLLPIDVNSASPLDEDDKAEGQAEMGFLERLGRIFAPCLGQK